MEKTFTWLKDEIIEDIKREQQKELDNLMMDLEGHGFVEYEGTRYIIDEELTSNIKYLNDNNENVELLSDLACECYIYDGSFEELKVDGDFEDFFDSMCFNMNNLDLANKLHYGSYNPMDELIRFDSYGNIETLSYYDYNNEVLSISDEIIEHAISLNENIGLNDIIKNHKRKEQM